MGDFDRKEAANNGAGKQNKQVVIAVVLGVVLLGVVGYHMTKQGPQSAVAGPIIPVGSMPVPDLAPDDTPEHAAQALQSNPTDGLLVNNRAKDPEFDRPSRNPFVMDNRWLVDLGYVEPGRVTQTTNVDIKQPQVVRVEPLGVHPDAYKIGSIMLNNGKPQAIVNGQIVSAGMFVYAVEIKERALVVEVNRDHVILQNAEFPSTGPLSEIRMQPRMK